MSNVEELTQRGQEISTQIFQLRQERLQLLEETQTPEVQERLSRISLELDRLGRHLEYTDDAAFIFPLLRSALFSKMTSND